MTHRLRFAANFAAAIATAALFAVPAVAQSSDHGTMHGAIQMQQGAGDAMETMMQAMDAIEPTGDADADFLLMMIPHHQSAVDMARASLEEMDDPEASALAKLVIESQEAEIGTMKAMLSRLGHPVE